MFTSMRTNMMTPTNPAIGYKKLIIFEKGRIEPAKIPIIAVMITMIRCLAVLSGANLRPISHRYPVIVVKIPQIIINVNGKVKTGMTFFTAAIVRICDPVPTI